MATFKQNEEFKNKVVIQDPLNEAIEYIKNNIPVGLVFDENDLDEWAVDSGYEKMDKAINLQDALTVATENMRVVNKTIDAYKECFEKFIPEDKKDEATLFLSTYGSGLAKEIAKSER